MAKIRGDIICEDCGTIGFATTKVAGVFWVEMLLYIFGIIFAIITLGFSLIVPIGYSISRRTRAVSVCKKCGGKVVKVDTPRGKKLINDMGFMEA